MKKMNISAEIINLIKDNVLSEQINKFIAPHFYLAKGGDNLLVYDNHASASKTVKQCED